MPTQLYSLHGKKQPSEDVLEVGQPHVQSPSHPLPARLSSYHFLGCASTAPPLLFVSALESEVTLAGSPTDVRGEVGREERGDRPSTFSLLRRDRWPRTTFCILMAASTSSAVG